MWKVANSCFWGQQSHRLGLVLLKWMNKQLVSRLQKLLFLAGEYSCLPSTIELCSYSFTTLNLFSSMSWNICCVTSMNSPLNSLWILQSWSRNMTVLFTEVSRPPHCVCRSPAYTHRTPCIITSLQLVKSFTSVIYQLLHFAHATSWSRNFPYSDSPTQH